MIDTSTWIAKVSKNIVTYISRRKPGGGGGVKICETVNYRGQYKFALFA